MSMSPPPARLHFPEQRHLSPCAPFLFAVSRLLVFCRIESSVLLVKSIKIYNWKGFSLSSWSSVLRSTIEKGFHFPPGQEYSNKKVKRVFTWLATRKTEAKPPEPSFFTILYSSFTLSKNWGELDQTLLARILFSLSTSVMGLASTSPGGGGIVFPN